MNQPCARLCRGLLVWGCLSLAGCGDDSSAQRDSGTTPDGPDSGPLLDAGASNEQDASVSDAGADAADGSCFDNDAPFPGCGCSREPRVYCCGPDFGIACTSEGVWGEFLSYPAECDWDEDAGFTPHDLECA